MRSEAEDGPQDGREGLRQLLAESNAMLQQLSPRHRSPSPSPSLSPRPPEPRTPTRVQSPVTPPLLIHPTPPPPPPREPVADLLAEYCLTQYAELIERLEYRYRPTLGSNMKGRTLTRSIGTREVEDLTSATAEELQEVVEQASMPKPAARRFYRAIASRGGLAVGGSEEGQTAVGYRSPGRGLLAPELPDRSRLTSSALLLDSAAAGADASVRVEFDSSRVEIERLLRAEIPKDAPLPTSCAGLTNRRAIESLQLSELALSCFENRRMSRSAMAMTPDHGAEATQAGDSERREGKQAKLKAAARKMLGRLTRRGLSRAFSQWCVRIFLRRSSVQDDSRQLLRTLPHLRHRRLFTVLSAESLRC